MKKFLKMCGYDLALFLIFVFLLGKLQMDVDIANTFEVNSAFFGFYSACLGFFACHLGFDIFKLIRSRISSAEADGIK